VVAIVADVLVAAAAVAADAGQGGRLARPEKGIGQRAEVKGSGNR
jgi:hypothetical protein